MRSFASLRLISFACILGSRSIAADVPATPPAELPKPAATPVAKATPVPFPPTLANVPYGSHERQILDFYKAESDKPTPLLFFIHGGGWTHGDKNTVGNVKAYLAAGISVVAINYRYTSQAQATGVTPPVKAPLEDAARALQFVRSKAAEWNIDKTRVAASGGSAGACSSLWLAFHKDMADPKSADPVARESTRLWCAAVNAPQTTLDPQQMKEWTPNSKYGGHAFGFTGDKAKGLSQFDEFLQNRDKILPWIAEYSPYALAGADAPPIYMSFPKPPAIGQAQDDPTHTANFGVKLEEKLHGLGVECELVYPGAPEVKHAQTQAFIIEKLKRPAPKTAAAASAKPAYRPSADVEVLEDVVYGTVGGKELHVDIARPKRPPAEPMPAVLLIHGGGWSGGTHKGYAPVWLAQHGYFTASVEYRLSGEAPWPAQIEDCKLAVRWLRANAAKYHVNPDRIGCMGHSAGGHLVACLGTLGAESALDSVGGYSGVSSRVEAVVDEAGPVDFTPEGRPTLGAEMNENPGLVKLFGGSFADKAAAWRQASAALHVSADTPPFLIFHGENDRLVPITQAERMFAALKSAGIPVELIRVKNAGHGLRPDKPSDPAADPDPEAQHAAILAFFDQHLKK
jgi:acetyl esterase/lipase